jgi:hypothetical protein
MLRVVGVVAILSALVFGVLTYRGSVKVDATVTPQGQEDVQAARNALADQIRGAATKAADKVGSSSVEE